MSKYVCTECGSDDIEVRMWVGANDNIMYEVVSDEVDELDILRFESC